MNNTRSAQTLRRRIALFLLISIINFVASPFFAGSITRVNAAPLKPFDGPTDFIRRIPMRTNDLVYSSTTGKIHASLPSTVGSNGNSIAAIDPMTGVVSNTTFVGSEPTKLALSDDGHSLYVWLDGSFMFRRFDALTNTAGLQFSMGQEPTSGRYVFRDFAVAPSNPSVLAVARGIFNVGAPQGVAIFDDGVRRTNVGPTGSAGADSIAYSASASKLYGTGPSSGLQTMTIDGSGVSVNSTISLGQGTRIQFSNGLIYTSSGQVINPDTGTLVGTFASGFSQAFAIDSTVGRAYYLISDFNNFILKAFDLNTFAQVGSLTISGVGFFPGATPLLRWGANGLALRTDSELILIQTSLIPSAEPIPIPTPTATPSPTPSPSPGVPAFVRQMTLTANDLVFSPATQKFYASVPSSEGSTGNSIAEIDPVSATVTNRTFVGSEPTVLGQADDGATLYVGLDAAASIRSYNILNHTAGAQFIVGRDNTDGPYGFSDIAVVPGNPSAVAVARQKRNILPGEAGIAIFDNGVQRPNTGPGVFVGGSRSIAFASASVLYGDNGNQGLSTLSVDNSGVSLTGTNYFVPGKKIILANGLIYGSTGQVINPTTGELVGTFSQPFRTDVVHAVDVANGRAFFLGSTGQGLQLMAYDLNTFLLIGFANIGSGGFPRNLVRWGTNGLAYFTESQRVVLFETSLVSGSGGVPIPTPTPSPTPSPSPAYIPTFITRVNLPANNLVISEATHALYASVPSIAGANGNSITKIIPETAQVGPSVFIGSEPARMAISNDGQTLWTYLNGANAIRRFDILTETAGLQFTPSPAQQPTDMDVVPGSPQSVALATGQSGNGVAIYDNGVKRPNTGNPFPSVDPIEFGANSSVLYGYNSFHDNAELVKYLVDSSGVTTSDVTLHLFPRSGSPLKFVDGLLYTGSGRVVDPEAKTWLGKFNVGGFQGMCVDVANHRVFFAFSTGTFTGGVIIRAFDSNTFLPLGAINVPGITNTPVNLVRWGVNGLAFNTAVPFGFQESSRVYLVQSKLVSDAGSIPVGLELEREQISAAELSSPLLVKVMRTGDDSTSVSVDYSTSDGTATAGSDYTATSGTLTFAPGELTKFISIPITDDNLFENGNETFNLTLSNPTNSAVLLTPSTATVSIFDNENKPFLLLSSDIGFFVPEGDSGTSNINFKLNLTTPTVQTVTVDYATVNGTATAGSDYTAASGTITIPAGASFATGSISINGDTTVEPNETFTVLFSNITNTSAGGNFGQLAIILNDDASVQLSSNALSVNESAGFVDVSVTRTGDTSRAATVLYSTTDTAGLQNCTVANSKASERCDYGTAVGRIQFAVGETAKTFTIPIVDDALVEGDETFTVNLTSPTGATLGTNTAIMTIVDNDSSPATQNPIDGVTPFITQQYIDFLGRLPDTIGLANWTDTLGNCPDGGFGEFANPTCDRVHVSAGFFLSEEFRGRGYFAYKFYEVGFDRRPAYAEFVPDMAQVGGPQSPASEVISKAAYTDAFVQRQEFKNRYDVLSNSAYVDALETNAEVVLANKATLVAALDGNQKTRAQVLREIVELQSVTDKFFIRAFVAMQYFGYLRRDPDTIGYNNWVNTLTADPSNFRHMIFGFIFSDEYRGRFGP
jgi:hypothetical protein